MVQRDQPERMGRQSGRAVREAGVVLAPTRALAGPVGPEAGLRVVAVVVVQG